MIQRLTEALAVKREMIDKLLVMGQEKDEEQSQEVEGQKQIIQGLEQMVTDKKQRIYELERQIASQSQSNSETGSLKDQIQQKEEEKFNLDQKFRNHLKQQQDELEKTQSALQESQNQMEQIKNEISETLTVMIREKSSMEETTQHVIKKKDAEIVKLQVSAVEMDKNKELIAKLKSELNHAWRAKEAAVASSIQQKHDITATMQEIIDQKDAEIEKLQKAVLELQNDADLVGKLKESLCSSQCEIKKQCSKIKELQEDLAAKKKMVRDMEFDIEHLRDIATNLKTDGSAPQSADIGVNTFYKNTNNTINTLSVHTESATAEMEKMKCSAKELSAERLRNEKERYQKMLNVLKRVERAERNCFQLGLSQKSTCSNPQSPTGFTTSMTKVTSSTDVASERIKKLKAALSGSSTRHVTFEKPIAKMAESVEYDSCGGGEESASWTAGKLPCSPTHLRQCETKPKMQSEVVMQQLKQLMQHQDIANLLQMVNS